MVIPVQLYDKRMPKLQMLKPRLRAIDSRRVRMLQHDTVNPRPRGEQWMETRRRIQLRDGSVCCDCGRLWLPHRDHVDHEIPREQGGSDDDSNLRLRCIECHKAKTAREAQERAARARRTGGRVESSRL
jgi:5-methylcytosine-specific restriction endonuclease McrA